MTKENKEDLLFGFQVYLEEKKLITGYDWEYMKEAKKYLKTRKKNLK